MRAKVVLCCPVQRERCMLVSTTLRWPPSSSSKPVQSRRPLLPAPPLGQALASLVMVMGYGIIAVPTGIVTAELTQAAGPRRRLRSCPHCSKDGHESDASFCRFCGASIEI